jgi:hypothetical protein
VRKTTIRKLARELLPGDELLLADTVTVRVLQAVRHVRVVRRAVVTLVVQREGGRPSRMEYADDDLVRVRTKKDFRPGPESA